MTDVRISTVAFDSLSPAAAAALLAPVCASRAWLDAMVTGRPFATLAAVVARSDDVLAGLGWPDVNEALAAHPRIGDRAPGSDRESAWSREEQSTAASADADLAAHLRLGNIEYEQRFGHVFLICATGRSAGDILASLRSRLHNDAEAERAVVRAELAAIAALRLAETLE